MSPALLLAHIIRMLRAFAVSHRASAAIEFAIVAPVALGLYFGAAEVSDAVITSRKVTLVTRTLVDLLSKQQTSPQATSILATNPVPATTLSTLLTSAATLLYPASSVPMTMTISAIDVVNLPTGLCCIATVRWSYTQGGTLRPCAIILSPIADAVIGVLTSIPTDLLPVGTVLPSTLHYLVADVSYAYTPPANFLPFASTMQRSEWMLPRTVGQVSTAALSAAGSQHGQVCY